MLNNITPGNPIKATAWVAGPAASGVGTGIVSSAPFAVTIPAVDYLTLRLEVQFTQHKTGGAGSLKSWARFLNQGIESAAAANETATTKYSSAVPCIDATKMRKVTFDFSIWQGAAKYADYLEVSVGSVGSDADTAWTVDDIKVRFLYTQLGG